MSCDRRMGFLPALAATLLLGACSAVGAGTTTANDADTSVPAAASPSTAGPFTGSMRCHTAAAPSAADPDEVFGTCEVSAGDPRLSGTSEGSTRFVSAEDQPYVIGYGEATLANEAGSWACTNLTIGAYTSANYTGVSDWVCVGLGDFVGLTAYAHGASPDMGATFGFLGWIEPTP